ncbi:beta-N-acetylhexosaminidase [Pedobacter gandavensis]|uniref:beta-N-acetylhexosaminidase n=1 Tax=Pedobacter gandavensis TaxID=2679963 RepID=A0ABR6ES39_9SPHI|nr:beta-N-acetylhexosaminidase [Pedobacter gandavensis]MBB2148071.1 family 20 glycosylhydrolase [Pedobacter gandavensis]
MNKLFLCIFTLLLVKADLHAQVNVIPQPLEVTSPSKGTFSLSDKTPIIYKQKGLEKSAAFLNGYLSQFYGFSLKQGNIKATTGIYLKIGNKAEKVAGNYALEVKKEGIFITAATEEGVFYGIQTLIQLLDPTEKTVQIPFVLIKDEPRFQYRGMHLDVTRHFFPLAFVKKYIDYLALHKMNYFHWHLTDDQGWRIEIKKYPKLTELGSTRKGTITGFLPGTGNTNTPHGGFYTQDEIRELVKYASDRYITVIPEIEMPGHGSAALTAYSFLGCTGGPYKVQETWGVFDDVFCAGNEQTFAFLQGVIDEVIALFPAKYIHIGGDECPKTSWKKCPKCQQRMKDHQLKNEHELQSYFVQRMEKYVNSKGKSIIGWDEILEGGLAQNATVMSWNGEEGGIEAAKQKHDAIMTPGNYMYFDYAQTAKRDSLTMPGLTTLQKVYSYEPVPQHLPKELTKYILGAQANVWTEYMSSPAKVEYMIFPRMSALSEVLWSSKESRNWNAFEKRLKRQFDRYKLWGANYYPFFQTAKSEAK